MSASSSYPRRASISVQGQHIGLLERFRNFRELTLQPLLRLVAFLSENRLSIVKAELDPIVESFELALDFDY